MKPAKEFEDKGTTVKNEDPVKQRGTKVPSTLWRNSGTLKVH